MDYLLLKMIFNIKITKSNKMMNFVPKDVQDIIWKMKHEMEFVSALHDLFHFLNDNSYIREFKLAFQAYARDGFIRVKQYSEGRVGQEVVIFSRIPGQDSSEVGCSWPTYDREQMNRLKSWGEYIGSTIWQDDSLSTYYGEWKRDLGNGLFHIRIMIDSIPQLTEFNAFKPQLFSDQYDYFPDFIPIDVIVPSTCLVSVVVPLDQRQLAVKYNFEQDVYFARSKVDEMALANNITERIQIVAELIEFFIVKPTMLIHSYKMRDSIYTKLSQLIDWLIKCNDTKYVIYIRDLVERMTNVLSMIQEDPLCIKN